jgi:hypothetical protein
MWTTWLLKWGRCSRCSILVSRPLILHANASNYMLLDVGTLISSKLCKLVLGHTLNEVHGGLRSFPGDDMII